MNRDEALKLLRKRNPFTSSSAGDPWKGKYPNVESINSRTFEGLKEIIEQKRANPSLNVAGLVLGEAGSGKTHLLGRILELGKRFQSSFAFAYIQPIEDPGQTYRYLLREIIVNLCNPIHDSTGANRMEAILARPMKERLLAAFNSSKNKKHQKLASHLGNDPTLLFRKPFLTDEALQFIAGKTAHKLMQTFPGFPDHFLKVLFQYCIADKRASAVKWLKGRTIDDEDCKLLGVPGRNLCSSAALEQEARDILSAFGTLAARYGQVIVVCFDRLENLETDEQISSFGKMVEYLVDVASAMFPIVCCRGDLWETSFRRKLNEHVITRLASNQYLLEGCDADQGMEIIRKRLQFVLREQLENEFFPFERSKLKKVLEGEIQSPREIITQANRILRDILSEEPRRASTVSMQLKDAFIDQYEAILADFDRFQPDRGRLRRALFMLLENASDAASYKVEKIKKFSGKEKYVDFMCRIKPSEESFFPAVFIIDVEEHHLAVKSGLTRGLDFFNKFPDGKAFYIRDARCPFPAYPRWPATNSKRKEFQEKGGNILFLNKRQAARLYALALLSYAVKEGDISVVDGNHRTRPASSNEFAEFIREWVHGDKDSFFKKLNRLIEKRKPKPKKKKHYGSGKKNDEKVFCNKIVELLKPAPMMMLKSETLAELLKRNGVSFDTEKMHEVLNMHRDRFDIIPSKDGVLVLLKKDWLHEKG